MIDPCAYTDRLSYGPGDPVSVFVDTTADEVAVALVRMVPDLGAPAPAMSPELVDWAGNGVHASSRQETCIGSFVAAPAMPGEATVTSATIAAWVWSTRWDAPGAHTVVEVDGARGDLTTLAIVDGHLTFSGSGPDGADWSVVSPGAFVDGCWYFVAGVLDRGSAQVIVQPVDPLYGSSSAASAVAPRARLSVAAAFTIAGSAAGDVVYDNGVARGRAADLFTGKIESPLYAAVALDPTALAALASGSTSVADAFGTTLVAAWDFSLQEGDDPNEVRPVVAGQPVALAVNVPTRGVQGTRWSGRTHDFAKAPDEYASIHFHDRDIADAGWSATLTAALPDDLPTGVYGISVTTAEGSDVVPIFVVPSAAHRGREPIAVLMPTFSYLAYANEQLYNSGLDFATVTDAELDVSTFERERAMDPRVGLSMYDHHSDGSGVAYSSARRPILNMRFGQDMWLTGAGRGLAGDMYLIEWLERRGIRYEIITDLELHREGLGALAPYAVVVTGGHPEYHSSGMLDALEAFRDGGGAIMYLGGNGFYWVTETYSVDPLVVEIRRGYAGIRSWESLPGEVTLVATGEPGGLWRHRGRAPQKLVGIGFCAQGWGRSEPYVLSSSAAQEQHKWIFDGVDESPLGAYGLVMGGAAGDELDRVDFALGTPPNAVVLGSSSGHSNFYQRVVEEIPMGAPDASGGQQDPEIKADIVYFETPNGGRVFSTGSIAWSGAMLFADGINGVSRVTENVLRGFAER